MTDTTQVPATKRAEKIGREFTFSDGTKGKRLKTGLSPVSMLLTWSATGETVETVFADIPEASRINAMAFGLNTNFTNAAGGKDSTFQDILDRREIVMGGEWAEAAGEGGPSPTLLAEAFHRAYSSRGKTTYADGTPFTLETVTTRVKAMDSATRKVVKADEAVAAAYADIELERAKERAKTAKAKAKDAEPSAGIAGLL